MDCTAPTSYADIRTLSVADAIEATGLPERTLRTLISTRRIPYIKVGKYVRFRPADLEAWLNANTHAAVS